MQNASLAFGFLTWSSNLGELMYFTYLEALGNVL